MKGQERRRHIRIFLPGGQVRVCSGEILALAGNVIDLSVGGVRFSCECVFRPGDRIDLEVMLPSGMRFRTLSKVIHAEPVRHDRGGRMRYGVQFLDLGPEQQEELGGYVLKKRAEQDSLVHRDIEHTGASGTGEDERTGA